jgi:lysozyme
MTPAQRLALLFTALSMGAGGYIAAEGWVLKGYPDPVRGAALPTACGGVTEGVVLGKVYTEQQCLEMQAMAMVKNVSPILSCVPDSFPVTGGAYLQSMGDTSFNIGPPTFLKSTMCRKMQAGDYNAACDAILLYDKARMRAGGPLLDCNIRANNCYGVIVRRKEQRAACLKAIP